MKYLEVMWKEIFVINLDYQNTLETGDTEVVFLPYYQLLEFSWP